MPEFTSQDELDIQVSRHGAVLFEAQQIFKEKNALRGDMWREFPPSDKLREIQERQRRIEKLYARVLEMPPFDRQQSMLVKAIEEDTLDLINYAVFFIRQLREGARG